MTLTSHQTSCTFEGTLQLSLGGLAQDVDCDKLRVVETLQAHQRLNKQRLCVPRMGVRVTQTRMRR